jgi:hypothetical protein
MSGCYSPGYGITSLIDSQNSFWGAGLPVFYRTRNYDLDTIGEGVREMGFSVVATTGAIISGGIVDRQICPQPSIKQLPMRFIEDAISSGVALRWGAKTMNLSHSFVAAQQQRMGLDDPKKIFTDDRFIGFYHDSLLFEVVSYVHNDLFGTIIDWDIIIQANELK